MHKSVGTVSITTRDYLEHLVIQEHQARTVSQAYKGRRVHQATLDHAANVVSQVNEGP